MNYQLRITSICKSGCVNFTGVGELVQNILDDPYKASDINTAHIHAERFNTMDTFSGCRCQCKVIEEVL